MPSRPYSWRFRTIYEGLEHEGCAPVTSTSSSTSGPAAAASRALHAHAEAVYIRMGVAYVTMHAEHVGSLLWPRLGLDFDLRRVGCCSIVASWWLAIARLDCSVFSTAYRNSPLRARCRSAG